MWGDNYLPEWLEEGTESLVRDSGDDVCPNPNAVPVKCSGASSKWESPTESFTGSGDLNINSKGLWTNLERFYEEENNTEVQSDEESLLDDCERLSTDGSLESEEGGDEGGSDEVADEQQP
jgi:AP-3 complex subunit beta